METLEAFYENYSIKRKTQLLRRNQIMLGLLIYQALLPREIINLNIEDFNLEKGHIFIKGNCNQKSRTLKLEAKQILLIYKYLKEDRKTLLKQNKTNPVEQAFFLGQYGEKFIDHTGINRIINENRPKQQQIQPIKIRQSVIANLLKKENDTRIVQVFAGHSRASTTVQYKQNDLEILQSAVNQYHPLK
jgi:integrase/recombinase XerD